MIMPAFPQRERRAAESNGGTCNTHQRELEHTHVVYWFQNPLTSPRISSPLRGKRTAPHAGGYSSR